MEVRSLTGHLFHLTALLLKSLPSDRSTVLHSIVKEIAYLMQANSATLLTKDTTSPSSYAFKVAGSSGLSALDESELYGLIHGKFMKHLADNQIPICVSEYRPLYPNGQIRNHKTKLVSLLIAPMVFAGQVVGILALTREEINSFFQDDEQTLMRIASFVAEDLERCRQFTEVVRDPVTGFYNRAMMVELLSQEVPRARRYQAPLSVTMMDVDGFSYLKPHYSEMNLDQVIQKIGQRIASEVRQTDIVGRVSDNGFLLLHPMTSIDNVTELALRLQTHFRETPVLVNEVGMSTKISMGISGLLLDDDDGLELISRADEALSKAKSQGGNQMVVWSSTEE